MNLAFPPPSLSLRLAAKEWTATALEVARVSKTPIGLAISNRGRWERDASGWWSPSANKIVWNPAFEEEVFGLSEFQRLKAAIQSHPHLGRQMDALVGGPGMATRLELRNFALQLLPRPERVLGFDFDEQWHAVLSEWCDPEVRRVTIVPFPGLRLKDGPVRLDRNTHIDHLLPREVEACLEAQCVMGPSSFIGMYQEPPGGLVGLKLITRSPKVVGEQPRDDDAMAKMFAGEATRIDLVAQCLALIGHGSLKMEPRLTLHDFPAGGRGFSWVGGGASIMPASELLTAEEASRLRDTWAVVTDERFRSNRSLNMAMRRLSYARHRPQAEDSLVDLIISCEAFFLSDSSGEAGYKLGLRGAHWSAEDSLGKRDVYNLYKAAYKVRSQIAHGSEVKPNDLKIGGAVVTMVEFVAAVERLVSRALEKAIRQASEHPQRKWAVDWDEPFLT